MITSDTEKPEHESIEEKDVVSPNGVWKGYRRGSQSSEDEWPAAHKEDKGERHSGQRAQQGQRHGGVLAYVTSCKQFEW